jgi:predicted DNA-binding protein with PD1-like motif
MEFASMSVGTMHILRLDPGEDVLKSIQSFLRQTRLRQAVVLGGYGTLAAYHLHWVTHNRIPTDNAFVRGEGGVEILAMNGLVVEGEPHIHMTLAAPAGAYLRHLRDFLRRGCGQPPEPEDVSGFGARYRGRRKTSPGFWRDKGNGALR